MVVKRPPKPIFSRIYMWTRHTCGQLQPSIWPQLCPYPCHACCRVRRFVSTKGNPQYHQPLYLLAWKSWLLRSALALSNCERDSSNESTLLRHFAKGENKAQKGNPQYLARSCRTFCSFLSISAFIWNVKGNIHPSKHKIYLPLSLYPCDSFLAQSETTTWDGHAPCRHGPFQPWLFPSSPRGSSGRLLPGQPQAARESARGLHSSAAPFLVLNVIGIRDSWKQTCDCLHSFDLFTT